jgi:hypothetical protein
LISFIFTPKSCFAMLPFQRKTFFAVISLLISCFYTRSLCAQEGPSRHALQVTGGYGLHGSGDMNGMVFGTEYISYLTKRFSLNYNFRGSINNGRDEIFVTDNNTGRQTDASIRFTTAGVQLGVNAGYSMVRTRAHEFAVSLGAFGRYQSASNGTDGYSLYGPQRTGIPTVLVGYDNRSPQQTYALGGIFQLQYRLTFSDKFIIGLAPGFQTDTNGDVMVQGVLTAGRRF